MNHQSVYVVLEWSFGIHFSFGTDTDSESVLLYTSILSSPVPVIRPLTSVNLLSDYLSSSRSFGSYSLRSSFSLPSVPPSTTSDTNPRLRNTDSDRTTSCLGREGRTRIFIRGKESEERRSISVTDPNDDLHSTPLHVNLRPRRRSSRRGRVGIRETSSVHFP